MPPFFTSVVVAMAYAPTARRALVRDGLAAWCALTSQSQVLRSEDMLPAAMEETYSVLQDATRRRTALFDFDVPFRGEPTPIAPFLGRASVMVNVKFDDPVTLEQLPGLQNLLSEFSAQGLHVLAFPTDQGWFEADDSNTLRLKFKSVYNFGQYPISVVFDKVDLLGGNALPLYSWLTKTLPNPWGVKRLVFDYEKFLVDGSGNVLRRYPRKFSPLAMVPDVRAALAGEPLPAESAQLQQAWQDAKREAVKSEYAFKPGLNVYAFGSPAS